MILNRCYVRYVYLNGKKVAVYAVPTDVGLDGEYKVVEKLDGYTYIVRAADQPLKFKTESVKITKLPDENSLFSFFPFEYLLGGRLKVVKVMDEVLRRIRGGSSHVTCFYKGCRKKALFYAESPLGLSEGGCWYACSREHFSPVTSKGHPIKMEDYRRLLSVDEVL
jgi:hypothetical protein